MKLIKFVYPHCGLYFFAQKTKNYTYINETLYNNYAKNYKKQTIKKLIQSLYKVYKNLNLCYKQ